MSTDNPFPFKGLTRSEVDESRRQHGSNTLQEDNTNPIWETLLGTVKEPMFLLLVACASVYFLIGDLSEALFMSCAIIIVSGISILQDSRSKRAILSLKEYTQSYASVIRDNRLVKLLSKDIVVGDYVAVSEGELIPADGVLLQNNDFTINESILTGEAFSIAKDAGAEDNMVYSGTLVSSGGCVFRVTAIGHNTKLGQIGKSIEDIETEKTPLQVQINAFVKKMAFAGALVFLLIWVINFYRSGKIWESLLSGLTIAMSVLPEEIPVAFATFMALGAYRLMKLGIIVKHTATVEALGAATVLCTDKTGTITENRMEVYGLYDVDSGQLYNKENWNNEQALKIVTTGMWASEVAPFDPMEKALHQLYAELSPKDLRHQFRMVHEYPLGGTPPMMTHIFENKTGTRIIACKGAVESLLQHSSLNSEQRGHVQEMTRQFAAEGLRVLATGLARFDGADFPASQEEFLFDVVGLIAFYDPPKKGIENVFRTLAQAGIKVKVVTGDNPQTAVAISKKANLPDYEQAVNSTELIEMDSPEFDKAVISKTVFSRMFPELKLKVVESLKKQGQIVGMTGDGVNDAPALKAAHIGIAMGKRGTETAKEAASLILTDDDFGKMVDAVAMGRKIYTNLKKAIQYIISIHIPIILTVAIPSILNWKYPNIFTPVHVIFLELIMGPTCSIIYENEPLEKYSMLQPPRLITSTFFKLRELMISVFQGLAITAASIFIYQYGVQQQYSEPLVRSMVFTTLIEANILLTLVNRSFYYSIFTTLRYKNNLLVTILLLTILLQLIITYTPSVASFFKVAPLNLHHALICMAAAFSSVMIFEIYKLAVRLRHRH